jgi:SAM-dependent methyltransferase
MVDDLFMLAELDTGDRVLEIGAGTGQLTMPMTGRGLRITALEPGPNLASFARRNLARSNDAEVEVSRFEDFVLPTEKFDLLVSATAFHWVDPLIRVIKSAEALKTGGYLAIIHTRWGVGQELDSFTEKSQSCYEKWDPNFDPDFRPPTTGDLTGERPELDDYLGFGNVEYRQYEQRNTYTTNSYLDLLRTWSNIRGMKEDAREGLLECLGILIDSEFDGSLTQSDLREMWVAERVEA